MFDDKLFEYLVTTDQLDDVLETKNKLAYKENNKKYIVEKDKKTGVNAVKKEKCNSDKNDKRFKK